MKEIAAAASDAKKIKEDLDRVKKSKAALSTDLASVKELILKAEQGPLEDVRRIRDKYSISPCGLQNMSQALFGSKITSWLDTGLLWYNRITPLLSGSGDKKGAVKVSKPLRGKGVDVKFREHAPLPVFLSGPSRLPSSLKQVPFPERSGTLLLTRISLAPRLHSTSTAPT